VQLIMVIASFYSQF